MNSLRHTKQPVFTSIILQFSSPTTFTARYSPKEADSSFVSLHDANSRRTAETANRKICFIQKYNKVNTIENQKRVNNQEHKRSVSLQFRHPQLKVLVNPWKRTKKQLTPLGYIYNDTLYTYFQGSASGISFHFKFTRFSAGKSLTLPNYVMPLQKVTLQM